MSANENTPNESTVRKRSIKRDEVRRTENLDYNFRTERDVFAYTGANVYVKRGMVEKYFLRKSNLCTPGVLL